MKHTDSFAPGMAACALAASTLIGAAPLNKSQAAAQPASTAATAPDDPAAGVFTQTCGKCHDAARITAMRRTSADWEDVIKKMIEKGAPGTDKDFETVYDYLLRNYGKLNINVAPPSEIVTILGLSEKEADSIVAYRKSKGPFADFEAVKKVPDIDLKKLDEHKDAVAF
jgi:competence ComEA-like helix-hairpin-helix protein